MVVDRSITYSNHEQKNTKTLKMYNKKKPEKIFINEKKFNL